MTRLSFLLMLMVAGMWGQQGDPSNGGGVSLPTMSGTTQGLYLDTAGVWRCVSQSGEGILRTHGTGLICEQPLESEPLPLGPRPVERIEVEPEKCFGCWHWQVGVGGMPVSDVPAIQETRHEKTGNTTNCKIVNSGLLSVCDWEYADYLVTTCADKSRVLLTSEDGKRHCIKF